MILLDENSTTVQTTIADRAHSFMMKLCTIPNNGICFQDNGWHERINNNLEWSSDGPYLFNPLLSKLLLELKIVDDLKQRELFLAIIKACPELVEQFWKKASHLSFEPRSSIYYISNIALATSVINMDIPVHFGTRMHSDNLNPYPPSMSVALSNIMPSPLTRAISSKALQHSARDVRFACGKQLVTSFQKLERVLEESSNFLRLVQMDGRLSEEELENVALKWAGWKASLLQGVQAQLPDSNLIILHLQKSLVEESEQDGISEFDLYLVHLELLHYYQLFHSVHLRGNRFDFGKLLASRSFQCIDNQDASLKCQLVDILVRFDDFKWWNKSLSVDGSKVKSSCFSVLLNWYIAGRNDGNSSHFLEMLDKLFQNLFEPLLFFQGHRQQAAVFWDTFFKYSKAESVFNFVENVFTRNAASSIVVIDSAITFKRGNCPDATEFPFAPIVLPLLGGFGNADGIDQNLFLCDLIMNFCFKTRISDIQLFRKAIETSLGSSPSPNNILNCFLAWLDVISGKKSSSKFLKKLPWKNGIDYCIYLSFY